MDGHQTAWHAFLRSDQLSGLTAEDREMLLAYGLSTVIDLRSPGRLKNGLTARNCWIASCTAISRSWRRTFRRKGRQGH